ncbi:UNVERIFIED_CONTAM: hypothetical protein PYX00_009736 [Menopon gallinae]|uniref:Uncharacterized protein n=1 Tax=Menopon gallinae TaxID=328185 RepID=A0AAW2HCC1_9NEOP
MAMGGWRTAIDQEECSVLGGTAESWTEKEISIAVRTIENIDKNKVKDISVKVEFKGQTVAESEIISVPETGICELDFCAVLRVQELSPQIIDDILGYPVLFRVIDRTAFVKLEGDVKKESKKESKKMASRNSSSVKSVRISTIMSVNVLGVCTLDISPLIKGKKIISDTMLVENEKNLIGMNAVSWLKLPKMTVSASTGNEELIPQEYMKFNNILSITVESIYNVPSSIEEGTTFEASILIPSFSDKMGPIIFPNGQLKYGRDPESIKRWLTLSHMEGRGALTKHRINPNVCEIINIDGEAGDMEKAMLEDGFRIQWNKWRSTIMVKTGSNYFFKTITKKRFWPLEITLNTPPSPQKSTKNEKRVKTALPPASQLTSDRYVAYLRLGSLLYPGTSRVRVASRLYAYSASDIVLKCGADFVDTSSVQLVSSTSKAKLEERARTASRDVQDLREFEAVPLFNENGKPVFIIVEIEVWKPYLPKREPEYLMKKFSQYFKPRARVTRKNMNINVARKNYSEIIEKLTFIVNESYKQYLTDMKITTIGPDRERFFDHLCHDEIFRKVKTSLEEKILDLVGEKYGEIYLLQDKMHEIFIYLIEEMRTATNSLLTLNKIPLKHNPFQADDLQLSAEEAMEEGNYSLAKRYLLQKIADNKLNPDYWLDYAIFLMATEEHEKSIEAIREALLLDIEHQIGLLMYALSMAKIQKLDLAELTFQVMLSKYPEFIEGWYIVSLFYKCIGRLEDSEFTQHTAFRLDCEQRKAIKRETEEDSPTTPSSPATPSPCSSGDIKYVSSDYYKAQGKYGIASISMGHCTTDPLSWTMNLGLEYGVPERAASLLLRLRAFEYAELALIQEPCGEKRDHSLLYMYYLAVNHYLRGQYTEAILHLQRAVDNHGKNCAVWALIGHCYYKLEQYCNCIDCFEYVIESFYRPDDIHLIYIRMGNYYMKTRKYHCARKMFLSACKYSPSSETWLGLGASYYYLGRYEEAEMALTEANFLDYHCPVVWAYLTLVNIQHQRFDLVILCYSEAKKKNLKDPDLIKQIEILSEAHRINLNSPIT